MIRKEQVMMSARIKTNRIRILAFIMASLMLFVIMLSSAYLAEHSDHECADEDCPICECIRLCESIIHSAGSDMVFTAAEFFLLVVLFLYFPIAISSFASDTPVTRKVRLND